MDLIHRYFPQLTEKQKEQFAALEGLYAEWNAQINVISRKEPEHFYERHVLHSLAIAKVCRFNPGAEVLDIGTGGGFPGIPLAILFPDAQFHLVDSIGKKIKVVEEVVQALGLKNVSAEQIRAEKLNRSFDFIVSRAVTQMPRFMSWTRNRIRRGREAGSVANGILYLKGGDLKEELADFPKAKIYALAKFFEEDFFETKKVVYLKF
ncbi:MAG: 16S rRNA (guanine(527)-N(7))-methyltransferase RsmG [Bacteroidetes bacterium]|nr:16S rRNA (guanine(527)-N(7))-methyltransferase RsmG [Bacteroidota bacterium]